MGLIEANWNPTTRQLRQFGVVCLLLLPMLAWLWSGDSFMIMTLAGIGLLILVVAGVYPKGVLPLYIALTVITTPIGFVVGEVALFLIYITVFLPIGIVFRVMSRDRLRLRIDRQANSYWQPKRPPRSVASYYRQS
jgi:hypothetical protein